MDLEQEVRRNTTDIAAVTNTVTRLAAVQESAERQRSEDRELMRKAVDGLTMLNEKMAVTIVVQENIKRLTECDAEIKSDVRTLRHDHNNTKNALQGLPVLGDKLGETDKKSEALKVRADALEGRINSLESWRDKLDGGVSAYKTSGKLVWALILALGAVFGFILSQFWHPVAK